MKVMVLVKADAETEAGRMPTEDELRAMGEFNEQLAKAGIMLAGEGLHPSSRGRRVRFDGGGHTVTDGPFTETRELLAGYWLWQVRSLDEATEWIKRAPFGPGAVLELRPVMGMDDFGDAMTPELRAREQRLRDLTGIAD
jgi:hypothetical protein